MCYESLRNIAMHFKAFKCVEQGIINVWGCTKTTKGYGVCSTILPFSFYSSAVVTTNQIIWIIFVNKDIIYL